MGTKSARRTQPTSPAPAVSPDSPADQNGASPAPADQPTVTAEQFGHLLNLTGLEFVSPAPAVSPADQYGALFLSAVSADSDPSAETMADLFTAARTLTTATRERTDAGLFRDALRAGANPDRVMLVSDTLTALFVNQGSGRKSAPVTVDPNVTAVDRLSALLIGMATLADGPDSTAVLAGLVSLIGRDATAGLITAVSAVRAMSAVADDSLTDRHRAILAGASRAVSAVSRGQSGRPAGQPVTARRADGVTGAGAAHVTAVMSGQPVGTVMTYGAIAKLTSPAYPTSRPSAGAIKNVLVNPKTSVPNAGPGWQGRADGTAVRIADTAPAIGHDLTV